LLFLENLKAMVRNLDKLHQHHLRLLRLTQLWMDLNM
jgi:hypothetical protein